jgi:hypothetical protein
MMTRATLLGLAMAVLPVLLAQQNPISNDIPTTFNPPSVIRDVSKRVGDGSHAEWDETLHHYCSELMVWTRPGEKR